MSLRHGAPPIAGGSEPAAEPPEEPITRTEVTVLTVADVASVDDALAGLVGRPA